MTSEIKKNKSFEPQGPSEESPVKTDRSSETPAEPHLPNIPTDKIEAAQVDPRSGKGNVNKDGVYPSPDRPEAIRPNATGERRISVLKALLMHEINTKILSGEIQKSGHEEGEELITGLDPRIIDREMIVASADIFDILANQIEAMDQVGQTLQLNDTSPSFGLWLANPNSLTIYYLALMNCLKIMSQTKLTEGENAQLYNLEMLAVGKDNARLAKEIRMNEAAQTRLQAMQHLASAACNFMQIGMIYYQRQTTYDKYFTSEKDQAEFNKMDETKFKAKMNELEKGGMPKPTAEVIRKKWELNNLEQTKAVTVNPDGSITGSDPAKVAKAKQLQDELRTTETRQWESYQQGLRESSMIAESGSKAIESICNATFQWQIAILKGDQGTLEQQKQENEALMQFTNKVLEHSSTIKRDAEQAINELKDMIASFFRDMRVSMGKG